MLIAKICWSPLLGALQSSNPFLVWFCHSLSKPSQIFFLLILLDSSLKISYTIFSLFSETNLSSPGKNACHVFKEFFGEKFSFSENLWKKIYLIIYECISKGSNLTCVSVKMSCFRRAMGDRISDRFRNRNWTYDAVVIISSFFFFFCSRRFLFFFLIISFLSFVSQYLFIFLFFHSLRIFHTSFNS